MGAESEAHTFCRAEEFVNMRVAGAKEIFLTQMAQLSSDRDRHLEVVVDDKWHPGSPGNGQNGFGHLLHLLNWVVLRTELQNIDSAKTDSTCHLDGCSGSVVCCIDCTVG